MGEACGQVEVVETKALDCGCATEAIVVETHPCACETGPALSELTFSLWEVSQPHALTAWICVEWLNWKLFHGESAARTQAWALKALGETPGKTRTQQRAALRVFLI